MEDLYDSLIALISSVQLSLTPVNIFEIGFIITILFVFYRCCIKGTHNEKFLNGIVILLLCWVFSEFLIKINLQIIGVFLRSLVMIVAFSLIVIFQPELRRLLGYLGQGGFLSHYLKKTTNENQINTIQEIIDTVKYLSKTRTGGLMVLQKNSDESIYSDVGTKLDANVSQELLLTIFHPNTPLHDGAVVIHDDKILAAGVLLPLTEDPQLSWKYGTRHRAAIGMSEISDAACLVVSEETGEVSLSISGVLKKYDDLSILKEDLEQLLGYKNQLTEEKTLFKFITIKKTKSEIK